MIVLKNIKKMSKIPTAEEFFEKYSDNTSLSEGYYDYLVEKDSFKTAMIEFAKLHVEQALKEAEIAGQNNWGNSKKMKDAILNSYLLENIK